MKKKILGVVLGLCVVLCTAISASAEDVFDYTNFRHFGTVDNSPGVVISSCDTSISGDIVIPSEYNGCKVIGIDTEAFANCSEITSITIPDTVQFIGRYAFYNCFKLEKVNITKSTTIYDYGAFFNCIGIKEVNYDGSKQDLINASVWHGSAFFMSADFNFSQRDRYVEITGFDGNTISVDIVCNGGGLSGKLIVAAFDEKGAMKDIKSCNYTLTEDITNTAIEISANYDTYKAFFWFSFDKPYPICESDVYTSE